MVHCGAESSVPSRYSAARVVANVRGRHARRAPSHCEQLVCRSRAAEGAEAQVIHYHGTPITPYLAALALYTRRHAMVSFARPDQMELCAEICQSFSLDNGAFSFWTAGAGGVDVKGYAAWVRQWDRHPGFDWCLIPDTVDGDEDANDRLAAEWFQAGMRHGVPVWHMHESLDRLVRLCHTHQRVALGSSGEFSVVGNIPWWNRMTEAMNAICDENGHPPCKLHGLRMLDPTVFSQLPLASADSTNVARNIGIDAKWDRSPYVPRSKQVRALVLADRIEHHTSAARWMDTRGVQKNLELIG
jgi:hypothetical protein